MLYMCSKFKYTYQDSPSFFHTFGDSRLGQLWLLDTSMSWGHSAKGGRVERTQFVPSISNSPLLRLHTGEIATDGRTQLHTHYVPASSLLAFDSPNISSEGLLFNSNWDESPPEEDGLQDLIACDKHKHTAAVSIISLHLSHNLNIMY
jgi:hypothetical protein